jgi:hypothetical protein
MAVQSDTSRIQYAGNNSTVTSYAVPFVFLENSHLQAIARTSAGVESAVTLTNHTGAGDVNGGTVRTSVAVPATSTLTIYREVPITQTTQYQEGGDFPAASHERALDKLTQVAQQLDRGLERTIRFSESSQSNQLPAPPSGKQIIVASNGVLDWEPERQVPAYPTSGGTKLLTSAGGGAVPTWQDAPSIAVGAVAATGSTTPRFLADRFADVVNVKDFGAIGDGIEDDGPAIRAAATEALSSGKILFFPSGKYKISTDHLNRSVVNTGTVGYGIPFINSSTTVPLRLCVIGHNAEIFSPITGSVAANSFFAVFVRGWFEQVHIEGLKFTCTAQTPTVFNQASRRFAISLDPHLYTYPQDANLALQLKTVPTNVHITNCLFRDWTRGINIYHANSIKITNNYFGCTYGQLNADGGGVQDWTVGIGCRSIGSGLTVTNNFFNGWEADNDDGFPETFTDKRCADGFILCSGYLPVGSGRVIVSNNSLKHFQREGILLNWTTLYSDPAYETNVGVDSVKPTHIISGNYINGNVPSFVIGTAKNWGIVTASPHIVIDGNIIEACNIGILASIGKGGQAFVSDRERKNFPANHGTIISNNVILLNGGSYGDASNVVTTGIEVGGDDALVVGNQIKGWNMHSSNGGWDGGYNDDYGISYTIDISACVRVFGSQTGPLDPLKKYPITHIKENVCTIYSHSSNSFSSAFFIGAGDKAIVYEKNTARGCSFGFFGQFNASYSRSIARSNAIKPLISLVSHNRPDNAGSFIQIQKHVHEFYPISTGWYQLRLGQNRHGGCASFKMWVSEDGKYSDYTLSAKNRMAVLGVINYSKSTTQGCCLTTQGSIRDSDAPITKAHVEFGANNLLVFLYVNQVLTRIPLKFSSGSAAGYVDVVDGVIQDTATITNAGSSYATAPTVSIDQALFKIAGSGAEFTASVVDGQIDSVSVTNGGSGYSAPIYIEWDALDSDTVQGFYVYDIRKAEAPRPVPSGSGREVTLGNGSKSTRFVANGSNLFGSGDPVTGVVLSATGVAATDLITATGHAFVNGDQIGFQSLTGGAGLTAGTTYFVRDVAGNNFKVAATSGGAAIDFTTAITAATIVPVMPEYIGQQFIDTTNNKVYTATGTDGGKWALLN